MYIDGGAADDFCGENKGGPRGAESDMPRTYVYIYIERGIRVIRH